MVALVTSVLITLFMTYLVVVYAKRRPVDKPVTWGEALVWAIYVFFIMFIAYGIVPHQWLTFAENERGWTADRLIFGPGDIVKPKAEGGWFPFTLTYRVISDSIAALIYIVFLGAMTWLWTMWQTRGSTKTTAVAKSTYGRPLQKRG